MRKTLRTPGDIAGIELRHVEVRLDIKNDAQHCPVTSHHLARLQVGGHSKYEALMAHGIRVWIAPSGTVQFDPHLQVI